jgi:solute:Na+ symporter, SSS family
LLAAFSVQFGPADWGVVVAYLVLTSWLGAVMAGRQANIRDFFLGGRKLPWYAVSGSIVASEISALTFVSVPWVVMQPGGNLTYLQLGVFGTLLARIIVGYWLVPAYYQREIYSPFDYMHNRLGGNIRGLTTVLFVIKALLAQSSRIYLAGEVLRVVLSDQLGAIRQHTGVNELASAIIIIAVVSIGWTLMGGMRTVIWTDVALFACFTVGALVALGTVAHCLPGGFAELFREGWNAKLSGLPQYGLAAKESGAWGKFTFFDWDTSPAKTYTMWTAVIAATWGGLGSYGLDQTLAQRMFCCKNARDARWAIISSQVSLLVTATVALVGVGLYVYYQNHSMSPEARALFIGPDGKGSDRILPIFVVEVVPAGLKGMIIAAVFAAAISTMMGVLTATSQTTLTAFYNPLRERFLRRRGIEVSLAAGPEELAGKPQVSAEDRRTVLVSRLLVVLWGVILALLAYLTLYVAQYYKSILDLGLAMASYILGALLAGFLLSFFPLRVDSRGFMYSAPLSCMCVFALVWHQPWTHGACWAFGAILLLVWICNLLCEPPRTASTSGESDRPPTTATALIRESPRTILIVLGIALMLWLNYFGYWPGPKDAQGNPTYISVGWPWMVPLGSTVAFVWGYLLARRRPTSA